jgi:hypothetical protein
MTKTSPKPPSLGPLVRGSLFSPTAAAETARAPGSLAPSIWVYGAFLFASAAFYAWKPFDFPDRNAAYPKEFQGLSFQLKVMSWQPLLELAWIFFLGALLEWFREGKLFLKLLGGVVATALPFILLVVYQQGGMGKAAYGLLFFAWLGALAYGARRAPAADWKPLTAFMLAINAVGLVMLAPMALSVGLDSEQLFKGAQIVGGLWILGAGTLGLRALTGMRLPRCFMAVLLSMFMQIAFAFSLHMLGLVPKDILKALLYA